MLLSVRLLAQGINALHDQLIHGLEIAAHNLVQDESLGFGLEFHGHTSNVAVTVGRSQAVLPSTRLHTLRESRMILLKNGTIIDGTGAAPRKADVALEGDRISAIGKIKAQSDSQIIDCTNLTICPGFIDIHSHSDVMVMENDRAKADQGVTTEVVGNCGFSPYPAGSEPDAVPKYARGILAGPEKWSYATASQYMKEVKERAKLCTVFTLVGHGSLRTAHAGAKQGALEPTVVDAMEHDLAEALQAGASGFSTGLMYAPGSSAPREELIRFLKVTAKHGKVYCTHMRSYSFQLLESIDEQIALAKETGVRLQISHLQAVGRANWDKQNWALDRLEHARREGIDVEFDSYPYLAGSTVLTQLLPQWTLEGGIGEMLKRLSDPQLRRRIGEESIAKMAQRWNDIFVSATGSNEGQKWVGKNFAEIGTALGIDPIESVFRLLEQENGDVNMLSFNQSDDNLRKLLQNPLCTVISDGFYVKGRPHPRLYGTFPCLLGEMVRERKWLKLEDAIYRVTGKPAHRFAMKDRGKLEKGAFADVVVFDPAKIQGTATYADPKQRPQGIAHLFREGKSISS